jgi:hypothetical protein
MPKFRKKNLYPQPDDYEAQEPQPDENMVAGPEESIAPSPPEAPVVMPKEPAANICGINGCTTRYDDPVVMARHKERVHGIPAPKNLNQPKPRNENIKLA